MQYIECEVYTNMQPFKKWKEASDNKYKRRMFGVINSSSDEKLIELNKEFYNGIEFDRRLGKKVSKVTIEIDGLIHVTISRKIFGLVSIDNKGENYDSN